jgi:hypothetical protein
MPSGYKPNELHVRTGFLSDFVHISEHKSRMEDLPISLIILWNTIYMDRALGDIRQRGMTVLPEDVARLSPIGHEHVNVYGKYSFTLAEPIQQGDFHPLREVDESEDVELPSEAAERRFGA